MLTPALHLVVPAGDPANRACIQHLAEAQLHPAIDKLYGSWAVAHLNLARASLLLCLGSVPNLWRTISPSTGKQVGVWVWVWVCWGGGEGRTLPTHMGELGRFATHAVQSKRMGGERGGMHCENWCG